jgi:hypothetical protein
MANFFEQFVTEKEKEKEAPPENFFAQFVKQAEESKKETPKAAAPAPAPAEDKEMVPLLRQTADIPLKVGSGVVTGVRMVADAFGADSGVGQNLRGVEDYIASLYSAQSKKDSKEIARIMKDAEDKGVLDQVVAGAKAFSVAPVDMLANALGTSAPAIAAGLVATLASAPALVGLGVTGLTGALMGAGTVKGSIYEATKQALAENTDMSPKEIEARAVLAQEYRGQNLDQILMGAAIGTVGARTGVEPALARQLAKGIATKEAVKAAVKQNAAKETALAAERGVIKQSAITGAKELATEFPQGAQEQLAQNIALQREGLDVPTMRGVVGQGTLEGLAGLGMGAVTGGREAAKARRELAEDATRGGNISGQFTTDKEEVQRAGVGFSKESADLLMPASDAAGKPLVADVAAPEITETTPAPKKTRAPKISAEGVTPESIQAANDYVGKIDSGEKIKQSEYRQIARSVGLSIPVGKSNAQAIELIRNHLAQQGAPDATGIDTQAGGAGTGVAALADQSQTATGVAGPKPGGVVSTRANVGANLDGTKQQPPALNAGAQSVIIDNLNQGSTVEQVLSLFPASSELANEVFTFATTYELASERLKTGNSFVNVVEEFGDGPATLAAIKNFALQGTTSGTTTPQAQQTAPQGQTKPAAGTVGLGDISPELQDQVLTRQNAIYDMEAEGANQAKIAAAYKGLNLLEESLGLELTKPSTLSAKKDSRFVDVRKDILGKGKQATATEQDLTPAYEGQDLEGAMQTGAEYESEAEAERARAYQESLDKGEATYRAEQDLKQTEAEKEAGITLKSGAISQENRDNYDKVREEFPDLPEWYKLDSVDKDVYFENIRYGNMPEHRKAAQALIAYLKQTGGRDKGYGQGTTGANVQRAIKSYEDGRGTASKMFGVRLPRWGDLSETVKDIFLAELGKDRGRPMNLAGAQQDVAFAKVGEALKIEQSEASSAQKQRELDNIKKRQEEVQKEAEKNKAELDKLRSDFNRLVASGVPGTYLPGNIIQMIRGNNLQGVLQFLREKYEVNSARDKIFKSVAQALFQMKLDTKIFYADSLSNGDLAQYDPVSDTIYVTAQGMTAATVLHEVVHAATAKIVNLYTTRQFKQLTEAQIRAVEHLNDLMYETAGRLADKHPEAYEVVGKDSEGNPRYSLMEFLAYALTKDTLQIDLALLQPKKSTAMERLLLPKGAVVTNLPESKSMWSEFARTIAEIIGLSKVYFRKNKVREDAPYNYLLEISSSFNEILAKPTEPIFLSPLSAKTPAPPAPAAPEKKEPEFRESGLYEEDKSYNLSERENPTTKRNAFYKMFSTREGWRNITRVVQDKSYASRSLFNKLDRAKKINRDMSGVFNNFEEQGDLSTGEARQFLTDYLQEPLDNVRQSFQEWIKLTDKKTDQALNEFHRIVEMFHEPERRLAKWVTSVPLSKTQNLTHNGKPISAAERRIAILGDQRTGTAGLIHKVDLTQQQKQALWQELTSLAENHADPLGDSPRISEKMRKRFADPKSTHKGINTNMDAPIYNVLGIEKATVDKRMAEYMSKSPEERAAIEKILSESKVLSDATAKLNQIGNYWSSPVSNLVGMYNYQYYMPFKGLSKHSKSDELIDPESHGKEMQEQEHSADGRFKTSDNPVLQLINDAYRSAGRAGRRNYTQSIKNSVEPNKYNPTGTGVIPGKVVDTIKFEERNTTDMSKYKGGANIFHYNADGSIDIIRISDPKILNALRYTFRDASPLLDFSNAVTGFFGAMHTRYNYNFAPLNFVRDTLTNAWTIGASRQMGPIAAAQYLGSVSAQIVKNGLGKAMHVALLEEKGDAASKKMLLDAAQDPFVRDMLEYLRFGGKTTYLQGFSLKSNLEQLSKNTIGRSRIVTNLEDAGRLIDTWNNMFEFTGRTAAYTIYKDRALAKNIKEGMSNTKGPQGQMSPAERAAAVEAAAFVKNLANFEKVGERGRELGAAYMFIRPAATGAVRAIEAVMPAFTREKWEESDIPPQIANDPVAKAEYIKNFKIDRMYAQIMVGALTAGGMGLYFLSMLGAPDDEWGRNNTKTDNMEQWTRFARFHIPNNVSQQLGLGKDLVFQIPWGFGLGAFAATGAQFAGMLSGNVSIKDGLGNIAGTILLDSFLPLPISKIPVTESSLNWFIDSIAPSVFRPMIEFATNMNGIGQTINSASQRRMGDAFTGSDRIPEIYKDAAKWWFRTTEGEGLLGIPGDISPNTIYFLANSYLDGISKIGEITYNWANLDKGEREFTPKNDIPLFGSFFGAKTNVDSRLYGKVEKKIKEIDKRLYSMKKDDPGQYALYVAKNPLYPSVVDAYQAKQGELNKLRQKATEIRTMRYISPKDRDQIIKTITLEQNMLKHQMVEQFKVLGVEP